MSADTIAGYRAGMFDGEPGIGWLRPGWRSLRHYGKQAKAAIESGDVLLKAQMITRADRLISVMSGILDTGPGMTLGPSLMRIYEALRLCLWKANICDDCVALDDFDRALQTIDQQFFRLWQTREERR